MLCWSAPHCSWVLLLAGLPCFRPPNIWVHQAGVSSPCPRRAGWVSETRGSSRRLLQSIHNHPCPSGSTWPLASRSLRLVAKKWSELMGGWVSNRFPLLEGRWGSGFTACLVACHSFLASFPWAWLLTWGVAIFSFICVSSRLGRPSLAKHLSWFSYHWTQHCGNTLEHLLRISSVSFWNGVWQK